MTKKKKTVDSQIKGAWVVIAALLVAAILIFDFITKGVGVVDKIVEVCCSPEPVTPSVTVKPIDATWGGQCLEFAFENLPKGFALGKIKLEILSSKGPSPLGGAQAATILTSDVHSELPVTLFINPKPIEVNVRLQADKENDAMYVNYCPTLNRKGLQGSLTVQPKFLTPTDKPIKNLQILYPKPEMKSVTFTVSRPRNLVPKIVPSIVKRAL